MAGEQLFAGLQGLGLVSSEDRGHREDRPGDVVHILDSESRLSSLRRRESKHPAIDIDANVTVPILHPLALIDLTFENHFCLSALPENHSARYAVGLNHVIDGVPIAINPGTHLTEESIESVGAGCQLKPTGGATALRLAWVE